MRLKNPAHGEEKMNVNKERDIKVVKFPADRGLSEICCPVQLNSLCCA